MCPRSLLDGFNWRGPTCTEDSELEAMQRRWYDLILMRKHRVVGDTEMPDSTIIMQQFPKQMPMRPQKGMRCQGSG